MSSRTVGLLAEDHTDVEVVRTLAQRLAPGRLKILPWVGNGCGRIKKKGQRQVADLVARGASHIVVLHDLDRDPQNGELRKEPTLRRDLAALVDQTRAPTLVCIPIEELEAWFWACDQALSRVARAPQPSHPNPHLIARPKEELQKLSVGQNRKPRYSTNENPKLAELLDMDLCADRCPSFRELRAFLVAAAA